MSAPLERRTALVTGASRGIGLAASELLLAAGARVVRLARSLSDGSSGRRTDFRCDVTRAEEVERVVERVLASALTPDIVVNNAGAFLLKPAAETTPEEFAHQLAVNLTAAFLVARALVPHLVRMGGGDLVTIGSIADHLALEGNAAYAASKFGVRGLHEVLRQELAPRGVRATLISPGPVDTAIWNQSSPEARFVPRERMLHPEDVAEAVLWTVTRPRRVAVTDIRMGPNA